MKEYEAFRSTNLELTIIGKNDLIRTDIDLKRIDANGRPYFEQTRLGVPPKYSSASISASIAFCK